MIRGISYALDAFAPESIPGDLRVIREELHCTAVMLIGADAGRLLAATSLALDAGLDVYVRPYLSGARTRRLVAHLREVAAGAERIRRAHPGRVTLVIGNELSLTTRVVVPLPLELVRLRVLLRWRRLLRRRVTRRVNGLLTTLEATARAEFGGPLTYAAAMWEEVDQSCLDVVGVNLYRTGDDKAAYERRLRMLVSSTDKPFVVTEFGCGAFAGADRRGPGSFLVVDWFADPPRVREGTVRDESVQAAYLGELIDLYAEVGVDGCFVFTFGMPEFPYDSDPRRDLDMAGFGVVRIQDGGPWVRKAAFDTVAERYARG